MTEARENISAALQWALDTSVDAATASADWLAMDIDPRHPTAEGLLTDSALGLMQIRRAKDAYKTLRIVGETAQDRRLGARLYAASIAAGLVWHDRRISRQSDAALRRAFTSLLDDSSMSRPLRDLAGKALCMLPQLPLHDEGAPIPEPPSEDDPLPMPPWEDDDDAVPLA
jgi:hypothetical protein